MTPASSERQHLVATEIAIGNVGEAPVPPTMKTKVSESGFQSMGLTTQLLHRTRHLVIVDKCAHDLDIDFYGCFIG